MVWIDNSLASIEYEGHPEGGGYGEAGMHHWASYNDGGGEGEDGREFVAQYGDGVGVIMVFEEVGLVKGP